MENLEDFDAKIWERFKMVGSCGSAIAREELMEFFSGIPLDHPLRIKYNRMLEDYEIVGEKDGN